jgi:hypothetical protein
MLEHNQTLALYRFLNQPATQQTTIESDMGAALRDGKPPYYGHMYVTGWETRNLRMASNIRDMLGLQPGIRALVIVGQSHKAYLEAYLDQMHDARIVDAEAVLR